MYRGEEVIYHLAWNNKGVMAAVEQRYDTAERFVCVESKQEPDLLVHVRIACIACRYKFTVFSINHVKCVRKTCNVLEHYGTILRRFEKGAFEHIKHSSKTVMKPSQNQKHPAWDIAKAIQIQSRRAASRCKWNKLCRWEMSANSKNQRWYQNDFMNVGWDCTTALKAHLDRYFISSCVL